MACRKQDTKLAQKQSSLAYAEILCEVSAYALLFSPMLDIQATIKRKMLTNNNKNDRKKCFILMSSFC